MDGEAWWAAVHGVAKSRTRLSDFTFTFHFHALEKEMATRSSILAWRIPGTEEPSGLLSMGLHRVGHDWSDLAAAAWLWPPYRDVSGPRSILSGGCLETARCNDWVVPESNWRFCFSGWGNGRTRSVIQTSLSVDRCYLFSSFPIHSSFHLLKIVFERWSEWKSLSRVWLFATNGLYSPWHSSGQNTRVGSCSLLQGIFPTQGLNPGLPHCRQILYQLSYQGSQNETLKVWPWWKVKTHKYIFMQIYKYKMKMCQEFKSLVRKTPDIAKHPKEHK